MPGYDTAPLYSDPWTKTTYLGQCIIVHTPWWSKTITLAGVTCSLYLVRLLYTETLIDSFVDNASISTVTDYVEHNLAMSAVEPSTNLTNDDTELRFDSPTNESHSWTVYIPLYAQPSLDVLEQIRIFRSIQGVPIATSSITISLVRMPSGTPGTPTAVIATATSTTQPMTYSTLSCTPHPPHTFGALYAYAFKTDVSLDSNPMNPSIAFLKSPAFRITRVI